MFFCWQKFGKLINMCKDPMKGTVWAFTDTSVFKYKIVREARYASIHLLTSYSFLFLFVQTEHKFVYQKKLPPLIVTHETPNYNTLFRMCLMTLGQIQPCMGILFFASQLFIFYFLTLSCVSLTENIIAYNLVAKLFFICGNKSAIYTC